MKEVMSTPRCPPWAGQTVLHGKDESMLLRRLALTACVVAGMTVSTRDALAECTECGCDEEDPVFIQWDKRDMAGLLAARKKLHNARIQHKRLSQSPKSANRKKP